MGHIIGRFKWYLTAAASRMIRCVICSVPHRPGQRVIGSQSCSSARSKGFEIPYDLYITVFMGESRGGSIGCAKIKEEIKGITEEIKGL